LKEQIVFFGNKRFRSAAAAAVGISLMAGCGGGGGGGGNPGGGHAISGDNLQFAAVTADVKAAAAGSAGPLQVLQAIQTNANSMLAHRTRTAPTLVDFLNLYMSESVSASSITMNYSATANGGHDAGQIVISTTDKKTFHATGSITGGGLPLTLDMTVVLTNSSGANTINGTVNLTKQQISFTMKNLSADATGAIAKTGEMDVNYQGLATTVFTGFSGNATGDIKGNVSVAEGGKTLSGTGVLNLLDGSVQLDIKTPDNADLLTAILVAKLNSAISLTDGKAIDVNDLLDFDLSSLSGSTGGLPNGSTTAYSAPVAVSGPSGASNVFVSQALPNGQMVGQATVSSGTEAVYWDSPASIPAALPMPVGAVSSVAYGIANTGSKRIVVGSYTVAGGFSEPCSWTSTSGSGTTFAAPVIYSINATKYPSGGTVRAISRNGAYAVGTVLVGVNDVPVQFTSSGVLEFPLGVLAGNTMDVIGVSNTDAVLATENGNVNPVVWVNVKISGSSLTADMATLVNTSSSNMPSTKAFHMDAFGTVVGGQGDGKALYWDNEGYEAHVLKTADGEPAVAYSLTDGAASFAGLINPTTTSIDIASWSSTSANAVDVTKTLPSSSFINLAAQFILSDGSFIALGQKAGGGPPVFTYVKKN